MKAIGIALAIVLSVAMIVGIVTSMSVVGTLDGEVSVRKAQEAQVLSNEAAFDKMWKIISQKAQIAKTSRETQIQLVEALVSGRGASFINAVKEQNPDSAFNMEQFTALGNSIEAQREWFFREQQKLIDLTKRQQEMFESTWSGFILGFTAREALPDPTIVSSTKSKQVMETGEDNDVSLEL